MKCFWIFAFCTSVLQCLVILAYGVKGDPRAKNQLNERANIIFILADDLDVLLGTPEVMIKTRRILREEGAEFENAFVTTPLCCPSRSSILTGRYVHNHNVHSNNKNCSSPAWRKGPERQTFAAFLQSGGYKTGYFGKYLNDYDGSYIPPGWDNWIALIKNSRFYNYTLNNNGRNEYHGFNYKRDYFTDVITSKGIKYFKQQKRKNRKQPLMLVISMAAPHGPEDPAPQYKKLYRGIKAPRTPSYNYTDKHKHWIVRISKPLDDLRGAYTDLLHRRRLLTMLSLDDAIERIYRMLKETNELENTYIFFSSDHGFHIGQFNLLKGKSQPYETDIRVPLYVRGPGVEGNRRINKIALNIDLAPTFLDIAGVQRPSFMDGTSLLPLLHKQDNTSSTVHSRWRDTFLVQRGLMVVMNNTVTFLKYVPKEKPKRPSRKSVNVCSRLNRPLPPCTNSKKNVCIKEDGGYVLHDCQTAVKSSTSSNRGIVCNCGTSTVMKNNSKKGAENIVHAKQQPVRSKLRKKAVNDRQLYQLMMSGSLSIDQMRKLFSRELARIKRKYRKRSLRYLRHLRFDRPSLLKLKEKPPFHKNFTGASFQKKIEKIDRKIVDTRKRLDALRERRRMLKIRKPTGSAVTSPQPAFTKTESKCVCEPRRKRKRKTKQKKKSKKLRSKLTPKNIKCYHHTKDHWRTPPFWTRESFSSCKNSPNNTFWCLRTINATHNYIYCQFVTSFVEYYDLKEDPHQLTNSRDKLSASTVLEFERQLSVLRRCEGTHECTMKAGRTWKHDFGS